MSANKLLQQNSLVPEGIKEEEKKKEAEKKEDKKENASAV